MWKFILLSIALQFSCGSGAPLEPVEGSFWNIDALQPQHLRVIFSDATKQRFQPYRINEMTLDQNYPQKSQVKRAFSILARLRPFSDIGKQRTSIRQASRGPAPLTPLSDLDIVSAETRAMLRPIGQPLRWG